MYAGIQSQQPTQCQVRPGTSAVAMGAGVIGFCYSWWVLTQAAGYQPSADSHYHFTAARCLLRHGPWPSPATGLPFTVFAQLPVDHYWGLHVLLTPFAAIGDYSLGLKLAAAVGCSIVFAALAAFFARRQVSHPIAWALLCGLFSNQDWRYLQLRGAQLLLPLMLAFIELIAFVRASRWRNLLVLTTAWLAMLSYHGAVMLLPIAATSAAAAQLCATSRGGISVRLRAIVRDTSLAVTGLLMGLVINPYADRHGSTFRFMIYHLTKMGRDSNNLYADQPLAEFHGMPPALLVSHPEWGLLLLATLGTLMWLLARAVLRRPPACDACVLGALALLGIVFVSQAVRMREYAVPLAFAFLAIAWRDSKPVPRWYRPLPLLVASAALMLKVPETVRLTRQHLPTHLYRGAHYLLAANRTHPVLNLAEADFGMLRIEYLDVVCVHSLSRYFLLPNRAVYDDLWYLYRSPGQSEARTEQVLRRFQERGVRLVATHGNRALDVWATEHPGWLEVAFRSPVSAARIYRLLGS